MSKRVYTNFNRLPAVLTADECADLLCLDPRTVRRYCKTGQIVGAKIGKQWRIDKEALKRFLEGKCD